jgi:hypothetical protein
MTDAPDLRVKRGDTWTWTCTFTDPDGEPVDLTGTTARLQVRGPRNALIADYSDLLVVGDSNVSLSVLHDMPIGLFEFDIELTFTDGTVASTETKTVEVWRDVTQGVV